MRSRWVESAVSTPERVAVSSEPNTPNTIVITMAKIATATSTSGKVKPALDCLSATGRVRVLTQNASAHKQGLHLHRFARCGLVDDQFWQAIAQGLLHPIAGLGFAVAE